LSRGGVIGPVVVEVGLGDWAVAFVLGSRGTVGVEPFLGGDRLLGLCVVGVPRGQLGLRAFGCGAGAGGVGQPAGLCL